MSLEALNKQVKKDLSFLAFGGTDWVRPVQHQDGHVYDVVIIGGGQSGLAAAFGLMRERISNILVLDENPEGFEGPWETYARMVTLRTPKHLTSIDLGILPSPSVLGGKRNLAQRAGRQLTRFLAETG